jgi:hypothetical protein
MVVIPDPEILELTPDVPETEVVAPAPPAPIVIV